MEQQRILVAGASGKLGRMVLDQLIYTGVPNIIATSRTPEKLGEFKSRGVEIRQGDFNDRETLTKAFRDADRLLLISTDDLLSGKRVQQHRNAIEAAKQAGIQRALYTSMPDPAGSQAIPFAPDHVATEAALRESGLQYTILRVAWYAENPIDLGLIAAALRTGKWFSSARTGKIAYVTRFDVARAAAAALVRSEKENQVFDITGPQAVSIDELAASLSRVKDKRIQVHQVDDATLQHELVGAGVPAQLAPMLVSTDANTRAGHFDRVTQAVQVLTGEPPISFEQFLRANEARLTTA